MKTLSKIVKQSAGGWVGYCPDGSTVSLSTRMTDNDVFTARKQNWHANNIWKVMTKNRYIPLGHKLGDYTAYEGTSVLFS